MKIPKKFLNVLNMNNYDMSIGYFFFFFFKIVKVVINLRFFFLITVLSIAFYQYIELKNILHSYQNYLSSTVKNFFRIFT